MSGAIFMLSESSEELENKWNPLQCHICHEQYQDPCILQCYHSFCTHCLESKNENGKIVCPLCGVDTVIKEDCPSPPSDALLKFLVESSSGDKTACANCDEVQSQMYFCNTCSQSLCILCREETHQAKMFLTHEIVMQTKHTRDIQKQCNIHKEPFILFSTEKKVMLCINCFRDMKVESRSHCVDLETAYKQGCQKLDDTMQSIRDLQSSVRDSILLLRALLEEIDSNVEKEKTAIQELYDTMQEKITEMREALLKEIDRQYEEKVDMFKKQLVSLTSFLPTLHVHLVTCAAFSSSANRYEFLDFTYVLMKRLMSIIQVQHPLHPSETSDIITEFKTKFARCLEPLLFPQRNGIPVNLPNTIVPSVACTRYDVSPSINSPAISSSTNGQVSQGGQANSKSKQSKKKYKLKLMETKGFFSDHCKDFDTSHREFMQKVDSLKTSVQELQRDITLRRSLTKEASMNQLTEKIAETEELLGIHQGNVEGKRSGLEKHWEESFERIAAEQEVYQAQLQDVGRLKSEVTSVKVILQKLTSFMTSIASVTQRLAPKLRTAAMTAEQEGTHAAILQEINTMQPDSQQRVDAISRAQEVREIRSANRVNPLDEELVKTKGLLRSPSLRKESTIKRLSAEIKETKTDTEDKEDKDGKESKESESNGQESLEKESKETVAPEKDRNNSENSEEEKGIVTVKEPAIEIIVAQVDDNDNHLNELSGSENVTDKSEVNEAGKCEQKESDVNVNDGTHVDDGLGETEPGTDSKQNSDAITGNLDLNGNNSVDVNQIACGSRDKECKPDVQTLSIDPLIAETELQKDKTDEDINIDTDTHDESVKAVSDYEILSAEFNVETSPSLYVQKPLLSVPDSFSVTESTFSVHDSSLSLDSFPVIDSSISCNESIQDSALSGIKSVEDSSVSGIKTVIDSSSAPDSLFFLDSTNMDGTVSDLDTSTESCGSTDDSVKPGLVKDLAAIVDGRVKGEPDDLKMVVGSISPKLKTAGNESNESGEIISENNISNDSTDSQSDQKLDNSDTDIDSVKDEASSIEGSPQSKDVSDKLNSSSSDHASIDDDEVYVTKSLPELAQVFEPGDLKQKRKRNKSSKSKNNSDI